MLAEAAPPDRQAAASSRHRALLLRKIGSPDAGGAGRGPRGAGGAAGGRGGGAGARAPGGQGCGRPPRGGRRPRASWACRRGRRVAPGPGQGRRRGGAAGEPGCRCACSRSRAPCRWPSPPWRPARRELAALQCIASWAVRSRPKRWSSWRRATPSAEVLPAGRAHADGWGRRGRPERPELDRAVAELQGASGVLVRWEHRRAAAGRSDALPDDRLVANDPGDRGAAPLADRLRRRGIEARVTPAPAKGPEGAVVAGVTPTSRPRAGRPCSSWPSSSGTLRSLAQRPTGPPARRGPRVPAGPRPLRRPRWRRDGTASSSRSAAPKGQVEFHLRFRRKSTDRRARTADRRPPSPARATPSAAASCSSTPAEVAVPQVPPPRRPGRADRPRS